MIHLKLRPLKQTGSLTEVKRPALLILLPWKLHFSDRPWSVHQHPGDKYRIKQQD
jgi:hypothetical protein